MHIVVFSTYDITPGGNGGEIRFQNLYRRLSRDSDIRVISYDLSCGTPLKRSYLSPNLDIFTTGVSEIDRQAFNQAAERTGLYPHDVMCISQYEFSSAFFTQMRIALKWAEVIVVTCPFLAQLIFPLCTTLQLKIYEAHNIEGRAKAAYFDVSRDRALGRQFVQDTIRCEAFALESSDIVLAVSKNDANGFVQDYCIDSGKIHLVPNGVTVASFEGITQSAKVAFREAAGLSSRDMGVFLGSAYGPNIDSYRLARRWLSEAGFTGSIIVIGNIINVYDSSWEAVKFTEHWMGFVDDTVKRLIVSSADFALQIVTSGGGTNLKLFDYMAAGIPILANEFGVRGVNGDDWFIPVNSLEDLKEIVGGREWRTAQAIQRAEVAHNIALRDFDWDQIVDNYKRILGHDRLFEELGDSKVDSR